MTLKGSRSNQGFNLIKAILFYLKIGSVFKNKSFSNGTKIPLKSTSKNPQGLVKLSVKKDTTRQAQIFRHSLRKSEQSLLKVYHTVTS